MKRPFFSKDAWLIIILFILSRIIIRYFGVQMDYRALFYYWQYLDVETLRHNLLNGLWYDHAQPPFFNLVLACILKCSGAYASAVFEIFFKLISLANSMLVLSILKHITRHRYIPLVLSVIYLLSPATLVYECELFYTTFISLLLLISAYFLMEFQENENWKNSLGIFVPLALLCLTRSMYHLAWLIFFAVVVLLYYRKKKSISKLLISALIATVTVGGWYLKNYIIFGIFSSSSWIGMNVARNVFHDTDITDSSKIEAIAPFSRISMYRSFISGKYEQRFAGLNDRDLLREMKNDSFINETHIDYIEISKKYMKASKEYLRNHPYAYLKNVLQSSIIFFTSATRYPLAENQAKKIKYYDILYSFNLSHFAEGKQARRIALTLSAIPKFLIYISIFSIFLRSTLRTKKISLLNIAIVVTIGFVFMVSSLLEHYENMRFRYEIEPLFLILAGQALSGILEAVKPRSGTLS